MQSDCMKETMFFLMKSVALVSLESLLSWYFSLRFFLIAMKKFGS